MAETPSVRAALNRAMAICSRREFCVMDIRIRLQSWGLKTREEESVINTLIKENFLNEKRYAEAFVKDRYNQNKWGKIKISAHLRAKKIDQSVITNALGVIDDKEYRKTIRDMIYCHRKSVKAKNQYDLKGKLLRYGLSKGFESDILYDILNESE
jgi:regulatory protein